RIREHLIDEEISIGNYVLTGGELPAMVMVDTIIRLIPGVLGAEESLIDETHTKPGYTKYPVYTRPESFKNWKVPKILLSGNHKEIEKWRKKKTRSS
ncbi:tRNA (guanosine(37)-N1)-methyltransferase TrmD, partial [Candidatus Woesebacteria bacterium]|nr:tRNA (guanosine(37)-N1)-methyltransferase TrmD [Candidatus Woesebacteria bacterium]